MKTLLSISILLLASCSSTGAKGEGEQWQSLFDGETLNGWRGYRLAEAPDGWKAENGTLHCVGSGGNLVTVQTFTDFDLELEWRISPGGNSGIFYGVTEVYGATWQSGAEMQVLDNDAHGAGLELRHSAGANYGLHAPSEDATRPVGEWNQVRIEVRGSSVRYFLNGVKVVEFERWTEAWKAQVAATKFADFPEYGLAGTGHIALQDHGNAVWYRNLRIREFSADQ